MQVHLKKSESTYSLRNPLTTALSAYILRNPLTFSESKTTSYTHWLVADSATQQMWRQILRYTHMYAETRKFCKRNQLTFWNVFQDNFLDSRNIQIQNCSPIQCTVWPRNVEFLFSLSLISNANMS